jgi:hypothetical protein
MVGLWRRRKRESPKYRACSLNTCQRHRKKAYILADNRLALNAGWDEELHALEFADLAELGFDAELTGFSPDEIERLFADDGGDDEGGEPSDVAEDDYDMDDVPDEPFVQSGDIWTLGKHRLMCGDSTDLNSVRLLMDGELAQIAGIPRLLA